MKLRGASGSLVAGGRIAGRLKNWTMDHLEVGSVIRATVEPVNPFWLEHCPRFDVILHVGLRSWRWCGVEVSIDQNQMSAQVEGKPEVR